MVQGRDIFLQAGIVGSDLHAESSLAGGGKELIGFKRKDTVLLDLQTVQARHRQDQGLEIPFPQLPQAGTEIAADGNHPEVGPQGQDLNGSARAPGTYPGAMRKVFHLDLA